MIWCSNEWYKWSMMINSILKVVLIQIDLFLFDIFAVLLALDIHIHSISSSAFSWRKPASFFCAFISFSVAGVICSSSVDHNSLILSIWEIYSVDCIDRGTGSLLDEAPWINCVINMKILLCYAMKIWQNIEQFRRTAKFLLARLRSYIPIFPFIECLAFHECLFMYSRSWFFSHKLIWKAYVVVISLCSIP